MKLKLLKNTIPSLGIGFFVVDDVHFQDKFEEKGHDDVIIVRGCCIEETIYCILNELWRLNEKRPIYIVRRSYRVFRFFLLYILLSFLFNIPVAVGTGLVLMLGMLILTKNICNILMI